MKKTGIYKKCPICLVDYYVKNYRINESLYCSRKCHGIFKRGKPSHLKGKPSKYKGVKRSPEICKKISLSKIGKKRKPFSLQARLNMSLVKRGSKAYQWKEDRNTLCRFSKQGERRTSAYFFWRKSVWLRDNYKCKIANPDCKGRIEAHHILGWTEYPELRYQLNNGITLCHAHHPRKRVEEKRLIPFFNELVSVSKE